MPGSAFSAGDDVEGRGGPVFTIVTREARTPSLRTMFCCTAKPSRTWATSRR